MEGMIESNQPVSTGTGQKVSTEQGNVSDLKLEQDAFLSKVMIALDFPSSDVAWQFIDRLERLEGISLGRLGALEKPWLKVGMQLYYAAGPALISALKERGYPVFLDLKLHDIPNTVKGAAQSITQLGVDMFNLHCAGGKDMMEAALEGIDKGLNKGMNQGMNGDQASAPILIGVTQLTSTSQAVMNKQIGIPGTVEECVLQYAALAQESGLQGVVCSPLEIELIKSKLGQEFLTVTPGIRLSKETKDDQVRFTTHLEAQRMGTDYMVIGRAITQADEPMAVYQQIMEELRGAR